MFLVGSASNPQKLLTHQTNMTQGKFKITKEETFVNDVSRGARYDLIYKHDSGYSPSIFNIESKDLEDLHELISKVLEK